MAKKRSTWGSKRERGMNTWELRWRNSDGSPGRETFYGTETEADDRLAILRVKHLKIKDGSITIDEFFYGTLVPECEQRVEDGSMALQTLIDYKSKYLTYIKKPFGKCRLNGLKAHMVQDEITKMTAGAARQFKTLLRMIMRRAEDLDYIEYHPMNKRYIMPTKTVAHKRTKDIYSEDELIEIFELCRDQWWEAAYIMMAFGGGIPSEVGGVKPDEVRFDKTETGLFAVVPINRTVHDQRGGGVIISERAKNEYRQADLIVFPPYSGRLRSCIKQALIDGDEYLFDDGFGMPVKPSVISAAFKSWLSKQPIRFIPAGNLRNAYSTMMHAHGVNDDMVQKLMRHASKSTVDYTNYNRPSAAEFEQVISDAFKGFLED